MITLKDIKQMKPKEVSYHKVEDLSMKAFEYVNEKHEMNCCDKCGQMCLRDELTWVDHEVYQALCELCIE